MLKGTLGSIEILKAHDFLFVTFPGGFPYHSCCIVNWSPWTYSYIILSHFIYHKTTIVPMISLDYIHFMPHLGSYPHPGPVQYGLRPSSVRGEFASCATPGLRRLDGTWTAHQWYGEVVHTGWLQILRHLVDGLSMFIPVKSNYLQCWIFFPILTN